MQNSRKKLNMESGSAMLISVMFFMLLSFSIALNVSVPVLREIRTTNKFIDSKQSLAVSESGIEDVLYRLKNNMSVGASEIITINGASTTTTTTDISSSQKQITSLGEINNLERSSQLYVTAGTGVSFSYAMQTGLGGLVMDNNAGINGSVYTNGGNITGGSNTFITGNATVANPSSAVADIDYSSQIPPTTNLNFGQTNVVQDLAQDFVVSSSSVAVTSVDLYLKKVGTPSNITVRIKNTTLSGGVYYPGGTTIMSGTLSTSSLSTNYGWVNVAFTSPTTLTAGTRYALVLDAGTNASNYFTYGLSSYNGTYGFKYYNAGGAGSWVNGNGGDFSFKLYLGGGYGQISGVTVGTGSTGNAHAHTVNNSTVRGSLYCQTGSGNNKSCNTSLADPAIQNFAISDANIQDFKDQASSGTAYTNSVYNYNSNVTIGPGVYSGNVNVGNNTTVTLNGMVWIKGNLTIDNNSIIKLASSYGASDGVLIANSITTSNNGQLNGSGTSGSYLMAIATKVSTNSSTPGISVSNNVGSAILVAPYSYISLSNNAAAKELIAYGLSLDNNVTVTYESGLANSSFVNGPSGTWDITSWKEIQ